MNWGVIVGILVGSLAVVIARPWRFWWPRKHCPQCKIVLPRWNLWGWQEEWTCGKCGCHISG